MKSRSAFSSLPLALLAVAIAACQSPGQGDSVTSTDQAVTSCTQPFDHDLRALGYKADLLNRELRRANSWSMYEHATTELTELSVADLGRSYAVEGLKTSAHDPAFASKVESIAASCAFYLFSDAPAADRELVATMAKDLAKTAARELASSDQFVYRVKPLRKGTEDTTGCGLAFETGLNHEVIVVEGKWVD